MAGYQQAEFKHRISVACEAHSNMEDASLLWCCAVSTGSQLTDVSEEFSGSGTSVAVKQSTRHKREDRGEHLTPSV
jgi:hypothetical protein